MNNQTSNHHRAPASLDPSPDQINEMGRAAVQLIADYFGALPGLPIFPRNADSAIRDKLSREAPPEGQDFGTLLQFVQQVILPASRHNGHPRFFGYVASPGTAATALADLLASALNPNVTSWRSAPGPTDVERQTVQWIKQIIGYAPESDGLFVSGGSMANLCGLAAARDAKAPAPVTSAGCQALGRAMRVYISAEGHHSISKAAGLLGIGRDNVCTVVVDDHYRMDALALARAVEADLAAGHLPFCVVASAGTVNTGSFDDLAQVADVAARYGLWLHVDASYGGFAALAPSRRSLFRGIDRADSVALDPHKWLYAPIDCGCILYRDPGRARAAFGHEAEYTRVIDHEADEAYAFWDYGPELSRRFRALKVWMMLAHAGTRTLGEAVEHNCHCARHLARLVEASADFEMLAPVELSIFCFRYVPPQLRTALASTSPEQKRAAEAELDALNERILSTLQRDGSSYVSNARIGGRFALRGCVMNFRTAESDMAILLDDVRRVAQGVG